MKFQALFSGFGDSLYAMSNPILWGIPFYGENKICHTNLLSKSAKCYTYMLNLIFGEE